jgi:hypothetical protein
LRARAEWTFRATSETISSATCVISWTVPGASAAVVAGSCVISRNASRMAAVARSFVASCSTSSGSIPSDRPSSIQTATIPARWRA